jgi:hypothetical protein
MRLQPVSTRAPRRNETRDIVQPILRTLNRIHGVRVTQNLSLGAVVPYARRLEPDPPRFVAGLGLGSADIVGIVMVPILVPVENRRVARLPDGRYGIGRAFALEVKLPAHDGKPVGRLRPDQLRWLDAVRRFGGFATVVHSVEEATSAVERCREGASE